MAPPFKKKSKTSKDNYRPIGILPNISKISMWISQRINAQHCLVSMIGKWKESADHGGAFDALMTDLSKAFDCLHHELLTAKLEAYGFDIKSVKLIQQYLSNRKQRVCDLFYFLVRVAFASYAGDTTPYSANKTNDLVIREIKHFSEVIFKWFYFNYMKINSEKSHILFSGNDKVSANIDYNIIISENKNELLGIILDSKVSF